MYTKEYPLRIFLGDLTYDTVAISTESFPLNIGYVASYCKKQFGDAVDITLFKYIDDLEEAILSNPPDILGLSNYAWNHRIGLEMFRIFKERNPNGLSIFGGPNFPLDLPSQIKFMNEKNVKANLLLKEKDPDRFRNKYGDKVSDNFLAKHT